jgi:hypothetical protein
MIIIAFVPPMKMFWEEGVGGKGLDSFILDDKITPRCPQKSLKLQKKKRREDEQLLIFSFSIFSPLDSAYDSEACLGDAQIRKLHQVHNSDIFHYQRVMK